MDIRTMRLAAVAERCAEESRQFARGQEHDDRFCFELFRRAIVDRVDDAWAALHAQYHVLVRDWVWQHSLAGSLDNHEELVSRIFERFWQAVRPEKFATFQHLASLLHYLKRCAFAALIDEARARRTWEARRAPGELADEIEGERVDETALAELNRTALWAAIEAALTDPTERLVIYLSTVMGLKPREIARRHAGVFPTVEEVYRRKRLALERLRRDPELRRLWEGEDAA